MDNFFTISIDEFELDTRESEGQDVTNMMPTTSGTSITTRPTTWIGCK